MQLDLKLSFRRKNDRRPPTFHTDRNGLTENYGDVTFIYGYWDRHFGCWIQDRLRGTIVECVPDWIFLDGTGQGRNPKALKTGKYPVRAAAQIASASDLAFFAYFQAVPHSLRRLVSSLGLHQWGALDGMRQNPSFGEFVDGLQACGQVNYLHACFALGRVIDQPRAVRKACGQSILATRRVAFLNQLNASIGFPESLSWTRQRLNVLYRLAKPLATIEELQRFLTVTSDAELLRYASHARQVSLPALEAFATINRLRPPGMPLPNVIAALSASDAEYMSDLLEYAFTEMGATALRRVFGMLGRLANEEDVFLWRLEIEEELEFTSLRSKPFPSPPIAGDDRLVPLTSGAALEQESRHMRNCLRSRTLNVLNGRSYYFHWSDREEATVEVSLHPEQGWGLTEALGRGNRPLSYRTREEIEDRVLQFLEPGSAKMDFEESPKVSFELVG